MRPPSPAPTISRFATDWPTLPARDSPRAPCREFDPPYYGANGLALAGDVVFAAGAQTVRAIDVSNPDAPRELARFTSTEAFPGGQDDAHDLVYHNGHLFVTAQNSHSLVVVRVAD